MNQLLKEVQDKMKSYLKEYLSGVSEEDLEDKGAVFYMNGKNGTEFDWYVNDKLCDFMIFYNDEAKMGAVKTTLYNDGRLLSHIYGDKGRMILQEVKSYIDCNKEDIHTLAMILKNTADEKRVWDENVEKIESEAELEEEQKERFISNEHYYAEMRAKRLFLGKASYVSKKILDEGWKVGYMCRDEALKESDSGWSFMAGDEDDEYINNYENIQLMSIQQVVQLDNAVWKYINNPVGTKLVRISPGEFEPDEDGKEIFMEKRNHQEA